MMAKSPNKTIDKNTTLGNSINIDMNQSGSKMKSRYNDGRSAMGKQGSNNNLVNRTTMNINAASNNKKRSTMNIDRPRPL